MNSVEAPSNQEASSRIAGLQSSPSNQSPPRPCFSSPGQMDRHKYVKVAYHGFRKLSKEERKGLYSTTPARESFDEPDFALIDTLFSLAEAYLFAQLVDFHDAFPGRLPTDRQAEGGRRRGGEWRAYGGCTVDGTLGGAVSCVLG